MPRPAGRGRRLLRAVGYGLAFAVPVTILAFVVREKFLPVIDLDQRLTIAATDITRDNPWLRSTLLVWQEITQPVWVYIASSAVCLVLWRRHRELATRCLWAFVTLMVSWNLQLDLKAIVRRARPVISDPVSHAPGYSFPSGHVACAAAIATIMTLLLWPVLTPVARRWLVGGLAAYVLLTALDRVFLGVHFPSDVLAGVIFGVGLGTASYAGYLGWNPKGPDDSPPPEGESGPESSKGSS
ncbi:phosphatase PAP2 family protein [Terrabacter carboxydivorans]|uniref:Phosphatidic acid phosphatase type 2/haloperoxidase domain-containing protein n=1 Tax=Terrabacter carboxydivorans TaxID=619730 RepID=A0ABP5ZK80_9MICO